MLCRGKDDYTFDLWLAQPRWIAELTDGDVIHQDDDRPGVTPPSAWLRLRSYLQETGLGIRRLRLTFRDEINLSPLPDNAPGYFFRRSLLASLTEGYTLGFYLVGHLEGPVVHVQKVLLPSLQVVERSIRDVNDEELVGASLIRNPHDCQRTAVFADPLLGSGV